MIRTYVQNLEAKPIRTCSVGNFCSQQNWLILALLMSVWPLIDGGTQAVAAGTAPLAIKKHTVVAPVADPNKIAMNEVEIKDNQALLNLANTRINYAEKGLAINIPNGWEARTDYQGTTLLLQPAKEAAADGYRESLQIFSFSRVDGPGTSAEDSFKNWMRQKALLAYPNMQNYEFIQSTEVNTDSGIPGKFHYVQFTLNDRDLMQALMVLSSKDRKYLLIYTDTKDHFNGEFKEQFLDVAWSAMMSVDLKNPNLGYMGLVNDVGILVAVVLLALALFAGIRHYNAEKNYKKLSYTLNVSDDELPKSIYEEKAEKIKSKQASSVAFSAGSRRGNADIDFDQNQKFKIESKSNPLQDSHSKEFIGGVQSNHFEIPTPSVNEDNVTSLQQRSRFDDSVHSSQDEEEEFMADHDENDKDENDKDNEEALASRNHYQKVG